MQGMKPDVRVFADVNELSLRAAEAAVRTIKQSVQANGRCSLALPGGNTPRALYRLLSSQLRDQIPWTKVHVWGDERYVPIGDPHSNYRMGQGEFAGCRSVSNRECASYANGPG